MVKYEDECVGCTDLGLYCLGIACSNRNVPHWYCDKCGLGYDPEELFCVSGTEVCEDCLKDMFPRVSDKL